MLLASASAMCRPAHATLISFQEGISPTAGYVHDAVYIRESQAATNQNGDSDREVIIGYNGATDRMRGLFSFDLSAIEAAAAGNPYTIDSIQLVLTSRGATGSGNSMTINAHQYDYAFSESTATWNSPGTGDPTAGGSIGTLLTSAVFQPLVIDTQNVLPDSPAFQASATAALAGDNVLRLLLKDATENGVRFFRASDETYLTDTSFRPRLDVTYTIVPEPSTFVLGAFGLLALAIACLGRRIGR